MEINSRTLGMSQEEGGLVRGVQLLDFEVKIDGFPSRLVQSPGSALPCILASDTVIKRKAILHLKYVGLTHTNNNNVLILNQVSQKTDYTSLGAVFTGLVYLCVQFILQLICSCSNLN